MLIYALAAIAAVGPCLKSVVVLVAVFRAKREDLTDMVRAIARAGSRDRRDSKPLPSPR